MVSLPVLNCDDCGACCEYISIPPFTEDEWQKLGFRIEPKIGGPCPWFDILTKKCKHYEQRPQACKDFQIGCSDCLSLRNYVKQHPRRKVSN